MTKFKDSEQESLRIPPHSIDAEQSVLGCLLLDNAAWNSIGDLLGQDDFYRFDHRLIFQHIEGLVTASKPADATTVYESLFHVGKAEDVRGLSYLNMLAQNTPPTDNIRHYAKIVRDCSVLRKLMTVSSEIFGSVFNPQAKDVRKILDEAEAKIFSVAEDASREVHALHEVKPLIAEVVEKIDELYSREDKNEVTGVATGFVDLDKQTSGLPPGELIIVAGRPSMGKSAFSFNIGEHVAIESGLPVAIFSMEMNGFQLVRRMIGSIGRLDQHKLRTGQLTEDDWPRLTHAIQKMEDAPLYIDETPELSIDALRSRARHLFKRHGKLGLIIVDYLQLMLSIYDVEKNYTDVHKILSGLKALAKELNCPVIVLSQLNRALERRRGNKRPYLSDLRGPGAIEEMADLLLFIYRDDVYNWDSPDKGTAEIIIAKQRHGQTGKIRLAFNPRYARFDNHPEYL
ncbi:replicative DNA helicase [Oxalobacter vibrioformis]|uniref:Replicative DNA helicase n=1 Tax=Oxalobacter vibrioformis TaxID=933080 RepID=A0A9E9P462_9BURK|nr:replicative DNA helicase [Oxalobacter vibrioformis]WAW10768.1 replicative DNA helicase [Oxalobacter vibrioformis]